MSFQETSLWRRTLAPSINDAAARPRERLRSAYLMLREKATHLCAEISRDLPEFTVHDITHADALWELGDLIAGDAFPMTPTDGFVFGAAVLLHDAAMSLGAYPRGMAELSKHQMWRDLVSQAFERHQGCLPNADEAIDPPEPVRGEAIGSLLRHIHAERAALLPNLSWADPAGNSVVSLFDDLEIRTAFGRIIGLVSYSHWWSISRLEREMPNSLGAPHWCPVEWTVDPLKISGLLRVCDAAHIDAGRAPTFLRHIRHIRGAAASHWTFQECLQRPQLADDALLFTSGRSFPFSDAPAWWLCLDTLRQIDGELRQVDALFADRRLPRLRARRVAAVESPSRLVNHIPTDGWVPVDTTLHVSDLPGLVERLGGNELYGRHLQVPVRELIQNAADAVRARRYLEGRESKWGSITVRLAKVDGQDVLEVVDSGIGMSRRVLAEFLLDFGRSYWKSDLMLEEYPGLLASGFQSTGRYGIGFFSVFMLGRRVRVITRPCHAAVSDTVVLEFGNGPDERPILRPASSQEALLDGGTLIRVWLSTDPKDVEGLLWQEDDGRCRALAEMCLRLSPMLDVTVESDEYGAVAKCVEANDWLTLASLDFLKRTVWCSAVDSADADSEERGVDGPHARDAARVDSLALFAKALERAAHQLRDLRNPDGEVVGRACIAHLGNQFRHYYVEDYGVVVVGGLYAAPLRSVMGALAAVSTRASRDDALPVVSTETLRAWATEQASLILTDANSLADRAELSETVWRCGGDVAHLPICRTGDRWFTYEDVVNWAAPPAEILLVEPYIIEKLERVEGFVHVEGLVIVRHLSSPPILEPRDWRRANDWPVVRPRMGNTHLAHTLAGALIEALSKRWDVTVEAVMRASRIRMFHERVVGKIGVQEIRERVLLVRRPES